MTTSRGGAQHIPRPSSFRPGDRAPWADLDWRLRHVSLAQVRAACAELRASVGAVAADHPKPAAVLMAWFEEDGEARLILTKRPETMPDHQGQIAFPGGKFDAAHDLDLRATALREAEEEIGLAPARVEVVAELETFLTPVSGYWITPFVGLLEGRPVLAPHDREVATVFDVAVADLLHDDTFRHEWWEPDPDPDGRRTARDVFFYDLPGETIWGATARILTDFLAHLTALIAAGGAGGDEPGAAGVS